MSTKLKEGMVISSSSLPSGEWIITEVWEQEPRMTVGSRSSSYENKFELVKLNGDGTYNEGNDQVSMSTCYVYTGRICEDDIVIIKQMNKTYI